MYFRFVDFVYNAIQINNSRKAVNSFLILKGIVLVSLGGCSVNYFSTRSPIFESLTTLSSFFLNLFEAEQDGEEQNTAYVVQLDFV